MLTAQPINGLIYTHEEIEEHVKHKPHHYPRRNNYQVPQGQLSVTVSSDEDQTPDQLAHMTLYCPVCGKEGNIEGGRHSKIEDGYYYIIKHKKNTMKCIIVQQCHRDKILAEIKKGEYKKDINDPCLRYLATICKEAVESIGEKYQSMIDKRNFYSFKPS